MLPLEGVSVVDLSRNIAGPLCTMMLGDLGADVVKVERPDGGDEARNHAETNGTSPYFASLNRNKRSVCLDLKSKDGQRALAALLARSDILVENLRPGAFERLGFDDDRLRADFPSLIVCHISGFGREGPWATAAAYDHIIQGFSGLMSLTGPAGEGGYRAGCSIADVTTGLFAASAILAALRNKERSGATDSGAIIEISLLASLLNMLGYQSATYLSTGVAPVCVGNEHPYIAPYGTYPTAQGKINISVGNNALFRSLCEVLDIPEVASAPQFAENALRVQNRQELNGLIECALKQRSSSEWIERMRTAKIPCTPVHTLAEALSHPQTQALDLILHIDTPNGDRYVQLGPPYKSSSWETTVRQAPPALGENTEEVLAEL